LYLVESGRLLIGGRLLTTSRTPLFAAMAGALGLNGTAGLQVLLHGM
jgi:hypothetical protein